MSIKYIFLIVFLTSFQSYSQNSKIVYNKTTDSINNYTYDLIKSELINSTGQIFDKLVYCGPNLWERYSKIEKTSIIEKGDIQFQIPVNEEIILKSGKLIQDINDFKILWSQLVNDFAYTKVYIRKLTANELRYYWSIIFFDIDEPIYVIENDKHKIIIDFDNNGKIIFLEEFIL